MQKKTLSKVVFILALLFLTFAGTQLVRLAIANFMPPQPQWPRIYIRNDGIVQPKTALIQRIENTYILTGNIHNYTLEIQRSNTVLDGADHILDGYGVGTGIFMENMRNVTIKNVEIARFPTGIDIHISSQIAINRSRIRGCDVGIAVADSSNNSINGNIIETNNLGILLYAAPYNSIIGNIIVRNRDGFWCESTTPSSEYINILKNNITQNADHGIMLRSASFSRIEENTIGHNGYGIWITHTSNSTFFLNSFHGNVESVMSTGSPCSWDNSKTGNYWSDYNGTDRNGDGIGDTPYIVETETVWIEPITGEPIISGFNVQDNCPIMKPIVSPEAIPRIEERKESDPFPTSLVLAPIALMSFISSGLLVYFKKRKRRCL